MSMMLVRLLLTISLLADVYSLDICGEYPSPDPCLPGGRYDPLLQKCSGYSGLACYQCFSGEMCKTQEDYLSCKLFATAGNPLYLSEYWLQKVSGSDPCSTTPAHYRPEYQLRNYVNGSVSNTILYEMELFIQKIHAQVGNAETDNYSIVVGVGATMVIYSAVSSIAERILDSCHHGGHACPSYVDVFAQPPYYPMYASIVGQARGARWNDEADPTSPYTIEILTYPNNPTGEKRAPLVKDPSRVVRDMVYYWPMYTHVDKKETEDLMIFSSSKHDGLAGTRFGWGLVKDQELAKNMWSAIMAISLSSSVDIELRVINSMQAILSEPLTKNGLLPFHEYGHQVISSRFQQLSTILTLTNCTSLRLTNDLINSGAYAWLVCSDPLVNCSQLLTQVNLIGTDGRSYGATEREVRLSMLLASVEFEVMMRKLEHLCLNVLK